MSSPSLALQAALIAIFRGMGTAAGERFYSTIPSGAARPAYPYGQVWDGYETPVDEDCFDRTESTLQVDIWADPLTYLKTKEIAKDIRDLLHERPQALTVSGHVVDRVRIETMNFDDMPPLSRARLSIVIDTQPA